MGVSISLLQEVFSQARLALMEGDTQHLRELTQHYQGLLLLQESFAEGRESASFGLTMEVPLRAALRCSPKEEGWGVIKPRDGDVDLGWVAYCLPTGTSHRVLLVHLPNFLLDHGLDRLLPGPFGLWFELPGQEPQAFSCERARPPDFRWLCSLGGPPLDQTLQSWPGGGSRLEIGEGTLLAHTVPIAGGALRLGIYVPACSLGGGLAPIWFLLVSLAAAVAAAGAAVAAALGRAEREHALEEANLARREAELSASIAEAQWRLLLEGISQAILVLRDEVVVRANQAAAKLLNFAQRADLLGRRFEELLLPEERERVLKLIPTMLASGGSFSTLLLGQDGLPRLVELHPWRLEFGETPVLCLSLQDYTALEKAEAQLRLLLQAVPSGVALLDRRGAVTSVNEHLASSLGLNERDLLGRGLLAFATNSQWRLLKRAFARARRGRGESITASCRLAGDLIAPVELKFWPVGTAGRIWGVLLVANRLYPEAVGRGGEEVFSLLQAVVGYHVHRCGNIVQALFAKGPASPLRRQDLVKALEEVGSTIQQVGTLFQTPTGNLEPVDINQLLQEMAEELMPQIPRSVRVMVRPLHSPAWVEGDRDQLEYFLKQAVAASLHCLAQGVGTIELALERLGSGRLRLAVSDTGEVFHEDDLQPSVLPHRLLVRGLAWLIAQKHRGEAGFRERAGFGARVWIDLAPIAPPALSFDGEKVFREGKILVVDDEREIRESLASFLREQGYETVEAANGREAVNLFLQAPKSFSLVVLDLIMPEMDGRQVYEVLAGQESPPAVLLCTGHLPVKDPVLAHLPSLLKPFSLR
ncbi:MAG: response regulator [Thermoanaerobaculaceae bacterium]